MNEADTSLDDLYTSDLLDQHKAIKLAAYEERVVKKLLMMLNKSEQAAILARRAKDVTGKAKLTFSWFYEEYPSFPVWLTIKKVPFVHELQVKDLFRFLQTPIYKTWEEAYDERPEDDKALALVFDWPGVEGTQLVLHNWKIYLEDDNNTRLIRQIHIDRQSHILCLEQFDPFIKNIMKVTAF